MTTPLTQTTGRRKRAVARVRFRNGSGTVTVNGRPVDEFFPSKVQVEALLEPLAKRPRRDPRPRSIHTTSNSIHPRHNRHLNTTNRLTTHRINHHTTRWFNGIKPELNTI